MVSSPGGDIENALRILSTFAHKLAVPYGLLELAINLADRIVVLHWADVRAVAADLLEKGSLSERDVATLVHTTPPVVKPAKWARIEVANLPPARS